MSDLYDCMRDVISEFNSDIEGLHASCVLMLFMYFIVCLGVDLAFWDVVFVCVDNDVCEDDVCSVYIC